MGALRRIAKAEGTAPVQPRDATARYRRDLAWSCATARAFAERFGDRLAPEDRAFLMAYGALPSRGTLARKLGVLRLRRRPGRTWLGALGEFMRA